MSPQTWVRDTHDGPKKLLQQRTGLGVTTSQEISASKRLSPQYQKKMGPKTYSTIGAGTQHIPLQFPCYKKKSWDAAWRRKCHALSCVQLHTTQSHPHTNISSLDCKYCIHGQPFFTREPLFFHPAFIFTLHTSFPPATLSFSPSESARSVWDGEWEAWDGECPA